MPSAWAASAAVSGSIWPALLTPSVTRMTTRLLAPVSLSMLAALANPMPIAVPSSMSSSVASRASLSRRRSTSWSTVGGLWLKASWAKTTRPMRSWGRGRRSRRSPASPPPAGCPARSRATPCCPRCRVRAQCPRPRRGRPRRAPAPTAAGASATISAASMAQRSTSSSGRSSTRHRAPGTPVPPSRSNSAAPQGAPCPCATPAGAPTAGSRPAAPAPGRRKPEVGQQKGIHGVTLPWQKPCGGPALAWRRPAARAASAAAFSSAMLSTSVYAACKQVAPQSPGGGVTLANLTRSHSPNRPPSPWHVSGERGRRRSSAFVSAVVRSKTFSANSPSR